MLLSGDTLSNNRGINQPWDTYLWMKSDDTLSFHRGINRIHEKDWRCTSDDTLSFYRGINPQIGISPIDKVTVSSIATSTQKIYAMSAAFSLSPKGFIYFLRFYYRLLSCLRSKSQELVSWRYPAVLSQLSYLNIPFQIRNIILHLREFFK